MRRPMLAPEVFLDTAFAIALSNTSDLLHEQATLLSYQLEREQTKIITTQAVLIEIGNALAKLKYRMVGVNLLIALEYDPNVEIISLLEELYIRSLTLYQERTDKEWGLTDCISFIVMQDRQLIDALTSDRHFQQAGFRALLQS
jgi:uncharacterized protein